MSAQNLTEKTGRLACMKVVRGDEDLILIRDDGMVMRMPVSQISVISRHTQGVRLMRVSENARITSAEIVPAQEQDVEKE